MDKKENFPGKTLKKENLEKEEEKKQKPCLPYGNSKLYFSSREIAFSENREIGRMRVRVRLWVIQMQVENVLEVCMGAFAKMSVFNHKRSRSHGRACVWLVSGALAKANEPQSHWDDRTEINMAFPCSMVNYTSFFSHRTTKTTPHHQHSCK